ncbi:caspase family protein [Streptomyces sp. NPDC006235]|uniref:caspase family protein n=1 Tax=Streptomyces sp. NPDC006235 TaxID=3156736 RepID=UPI0033A2C3D3
MARRALVLANQKHDDERFSKLPGAAADARHLTDALKDPAIGGFEVTVVVDETARTWRKELQRFFRDAGMDDVLLVHLSCHGRKDTGNRLHFVARDTEFDELEATSASADFLADCMERSRSQRIVLLLDCCYSGAFARDMRARGETQVDLSAEFQGKGRIVITSSTALQYSYETERSSRLRNQPSVFTSAIVAGLRSGEADLDKDGYITVEDLFAYITRRIPEQVPDQTPTLSVTTAVGQILVAKNPRADELALNRGTGQGPSPEEEAQFAQAASRARELARELERHKSLHARIMRGQAHLLRWLAVTAVTAFGLWTASLWSDSFVLPPSGSQRGLALLVCAAVVTLGTKALAAPLIALSVAVTKAVWGNPKQMVRWWLQGGRRGWVERLMRILAFFAVCLTAFIGLTTLIPLLSLYVAGSLATQIGLAVTTPSGWDAIPILWSIDALQFLSVGALNLLLPEQERVVAKSGNAIIARDITHVGPFHWGNKTVMKGTLHTLDDFPHEW